MATASSDDCLPSKKRRKGYPRLDISGADYLFSFYQYAEMDKWSDDCVERILGMSKDHGTHGLEVCRVLHRVILYYKAMERDIAECGDLLNEDLDEIAACENRAESTESSAASGTCAPLDIVREKSANRTGESDETDNRQAPAENSDAEIDEEEEENSSSSSDEESDDDDEVVVITPEPKVYEVITIDSDSDEGELTASESTQSASVTAADQPSTTRLTEEETLIILADISQQIAQLNGIKTFAFNSGAIPVLQVPLPELTCMEPPSMFFLETEIQRVNAEAASLLRELEGRGAAGNSYEVVSVKQLLVEGTRIWKSLEKKRGLEVKIERFSPEPRERASHNESRTRNDSPISRDRAPREFDNRHRDGSPNSRYSREHTTRTFEKKRRHGSNKSPRGKNKHQSANRRGGRHSRSFEGDKPSTSRGRRRSEERSEHWCSFCDKKSFHRTIDCDIYATYGARTKRKLELGLCNYCLEPYNPLTCSRPEHKKICHICRKHTSNPALCKSLLRAHPFE